MNDTCQIMQISNFVWDSVFSDILWHCVVRIINVLVTGGHRSYKTQKWIPCSIIAKNSLDSVTRHPRENCFGISSIQLICPQFPFHNIRSDLSPPAHQYRTPKIFIARQRGCWIPPVFHDFSPTVFVVLANFTMLIIHHWRITASTLFAVHIQEFWLGIKRVLWTLSLQCRVTFDIPSSCAKTNVKVNATT